MSNSNISTFNVQDMKDAAEEQTTIIPLNGKYIGKFYEAIKTITRNGAISVKMSATINDFKYSFQNEYLFAGDLKSNKKLPFFNVFSRLFGILNLLDVQGFHVETKKLEGKVYDFDTKEFVTVLLDQYFQILHKPVGIVAMTIPIYKRVVIDGYTKQVVTKQTSPHHIYFEDYNNIVSEGFRIVDFYDPNTLLTYPEILDKKSGKEIKPTQLNAIVNKVENSDPFKKPSFQQMDSKVKNTLIYSLKKANAEYDESQFVSFADTNGIISNEYQDNGYNEPSSNNSNNQAPF